MALLSSTGSLAMQIILGNWHNCYPCSMIVSSTGPVSILVKLYYYHPGSLTIPKSLLSSSVPVAIPRAYNYHLQALWLYKWHATIIYGLSGYMYINLLSSTRPVFILITLFYKPLDHWLYRWLFSSGYIYTRFSSSGTRLFLWHSTIFFMPLLSMSYSTIFYGLYGNSFLTLSCNILAQ